MNQDIANKVLGAINARKVNKIYLIGRNIAQMNWAVCTQREVVFVCRGGDDDDFDYGEEEIAGARIVNRRAWHDKLRR
jgi:hypothetical protein